MNDYRIALTERAKDDIIDIGDYIITKEIGVIFCPETNYKYF